ncbi:MAG: hypothetical protein IH840_02635 [Candidatus Heimdallarchaeota archaeon]|nr:hypothetical protein [Candidatus Heimdallarchaeota archaeon]
MTDHRLKLAKGILDSIFYVTDDLDDRAKQDGKYTDEEIALLNNINTNIIKYYNLIEKFIEDDEIDDEENNKMISFENRIIEDAKTMANKDGEVSSDERALLDSLIESFEQIKTARNEK